MNTNPARPASQLVPSSSRTTWRNAYPACSSSRPYGTSSAHWAAGRRTPSVKIKADDAVLTPHEEGDHVRLERIDIPDDIVAECERRAPDLTWSSLIAASLRYALDQADTEQHDQPSDDETT